METVPTFADHVIGHGKMRGNHPAVLLADRVVTYAMLAEAILTAEAKVAALGLAPGTVVGICVESPVRHVALLGALARGGHTAVSLSQAGDAERRGVALDCLLAERLEFALGTRLVVTDDTWFAPTGLLATARMRPRDSEDLLRLEFSSGTTGTPKPYTVTAAGAAGIAQTQTLMFSRFAWSRMSSLMDVQSMWGYHVATSTLTSGKSVLLHTSHVDALKIGKIYGADLLVASAGQLAELVGRQAADPVPDLGLRGIVTGGALLGERLAEEACIHLCPTILSIYGSSEAGGTAVAETADLLRHPRSVGVVVPWTEVRIEDESGCELPRGLAGAIKVRPAHGIAQPYVRRGEPKRDASDWFEPGDLAILHEDGRLEIVGRLDDLINVGGVKIAPETVEDAVRRHPDVADCAAFTLTKSQGAATLALAIVSGKSTPVDDIQRWCAERGVTVGAVFTVDELPRTANGKTRRGELARRFSQRP